MNYIVMNQNVQCAILAWLLLVNGLILRKKTSWHVPLMLSGMFLDIDIVINLQITKKAVQTVIAMEMSPLKQVHVFFSTLAFILYPVIIYLGNKLLKGEKNLKKLHVQIAIAAFTFRTIGLICMLALAFNEL